MNQNESEIGINEVETYVNRICKANSFKYKANIKVKLKEDRENLYHENLRLHVFRVSNDLNIDENFDNPSVKIIVSIEK